jgi:branched-subunit amino acid transport protein
MCCRLGLTDVDESISFLTIVITGAVVLVIRSAPLLLLGARRLPRHIENVLHYLPAAALSALAVQMMVVRDGELGFSLQDVTWWALLPTILVAILTRNIFITVIVGMGLVASARLILA